jgi:succinate dehydrogenase / fumarate reductase cytochrome b subunit
VTRTSKLDLARIHSMTGLVPLTGFVVIHVWQTAAASRGRHAFDAAQIGGEGTALSVILEALFVILPLLAHAAIGVALWRRDTSGEPGPYASVGLRRVQRVTGAITLVFLVAHLAQTYLLELGGANAAVIYDVLRSELGRPFYAILYVIGLTAVSFHLAFGVAAAATRLGIARTKEAGRLARVLGGVLGVAIWLVSVNTLSHFVVGRAFVGASPEAPAAAEEEPAQ